MLGFFGERRALADLDFQEARHRALWREVSKVSRGEVKKGAADGAVLLEVGGFEPTTEAVRPFLLQELRVNPEGRFSLGTLDEAKEKEALAAARAAAMGVVFLVEGWSLSPKQMTKHHERVREALGGRDGAKMIRYVVAGNEEEFAQWVSFVDGLRDELAECFRYAG